MKKQLLRTLRLFSLAALFGGSFAASAQTSYTFTNCGVIGKDGPTQGDVNTEYAATNLNGMVTVTTQGIQEWVVPSTGLYTIEARGAQGGYAATNPNAYGGSGAILQGNIMLTAGQTIYVAVGQYGGSSNVQFSGAGDEGAGGGGSFVATGTSLATSTPLVVAGGGGGGTTYNNSYGLNASTSTTGVTSNTGGAGGTAGSGGANGSAGGPYYSSGGGGFLTGGESGMGGYGGEAFVNGAAGGIGGNSNLGYNNSSDRIDGGFGGGGSARGASHCGGGGGGGYSGGGAGGSDVIRQGGGGGSYMATTAVNVATSDGMYDGLSTLNGAITDLATWNTGNGLVIITSVCSAATDVTAPVPDAMALMDITGQCDVTSLVAPTATDDCVGQVVGTHDATLPITAPGTTVVTWTFDDGNGNTATQTQNVINPTVDNGITQNGGLLNADALVSAYQWLDCDNNYATINGAVNQFYSATATGNYAVEITTDGCVDTSMCVLVDVTGIQELANDALYLVPNPSTNGVFTIAFDGVVELVEVFDVLGRSVQVEIDTTTKTVKGTSLSNGNYIVRVITEKGVAVRELLIQK
jgi:hypothetical protein